MNEEQIRIFLAVAQAGSFSAAEETMHISKQAMLKQVNHLEEEVGVTLFHRSRSGVSLTAAGEVFCKGLSKIDREMKNLIRACRKAEGTEQTIRVGNVEHQVLLAPVTQAFTVKYPGVQVQQVIHPNHSGEWRVANGIQDVAETFHLAYEKNPAAFAYQPLTTVRYVAAMRPHHPLSGLKQISLEEMTGFVTMCFSVMVGEEYARTLEAAFSKSPENLLARSDVDHQVQAAYECIDSDRILITANPFIEGIAELVKIPLAPGWTREYGIIYREPASAVVQQYIETAKEIYAR